MPNSFFQFKQFVIHQAKTAMKVTTDACLFGAWVANEVESGKLKVDSVLDIGTGTGLLALMLAQKCEAAIDCVEIDDAAAKEAQENAASSPWKERVSVINGNAKSINDSLRKKFDVIISNPPFYEKEIRSANDLKNVAHHSHDLTLEELLVIIKSNLASRGSFFLLLPYKRNKEVKKLFKDHQLHISTMLLVRQSVNHDYFRIMVKGSMNKEENKETMFDEIAIWDDKQQYTPEFVKLLKDYYLHL